MRAKVDTKQLRELQKKIQQFEQVGFDGLAERCTNQLASRMIRKCVKRNEIAKDTGNMERSWKANKAVKHGSQWRTDVFNPVEYAPYVEYGHRTINGGWVNGFFIMTRSADEIERDAPKIIEKEVNKELARVFE